MRGLCADCETFHRSDEQCASNVREIDGMTFWRKWRMIRNPKPIPDRSHDWDFWHVDYDGEGDPRSGTARSVGACIEEIKEIEADLAEPRTTIERAADQLDNMLESNRKYHRTGRPPRSN